MDDDDAGAKTEGGNKPDVAAPLVDVEDAEESSPDLSAVQDLAETTFKEGGVAEIDSDVASEIVATSRSEEAADGVAAEEDAKVQLIDESIGVSSDVAVTVSAAVKAIVSAVAATSSVAGNSITTASGVASTSSVTGNSITTASEVAATSSVAGNSITTAFEVAAKSSTTETNCKPVPESETESPNPPSKAGSEERKVRRKRFDFVYKAYPIRSRGGSSVSATPPNSHSPSPSYVVPPEMCTHFKLPTPKSSTKSKSSKPKSSPQGPRQSSKSSKGKQASPKWHGQKKQVRKRQRSVSAGRNDEEAKDFFAVLEEFLGDEE